MPSVERGEAASRARLDAFNPEDRLDGVIWKSEDWHGHVISLQVCLFSQKNNFFQGRRAIRKCLIEAIFI